MPVGSDPRVGSELLDYRLEAVVGRGGMGVVYGAYDPRLKRDVALKLLAPEYATDDRFRERFLSETEQAASLEHPNVIPIHDAGEVDGQFYLVMRLADGGDLKLLLADEQNLDPRRAVTICAQIADALDAAHGQGLVHRDVKPSNVLLDRRGHVYLADFGLSRRLSEQAPGFDAGVSLGTPAYVAPEQIEGKDVDGRADQYSLACLLYECLTGRPPFHRGSEAAVLFAHLEEPPPPAPPGLEGVMRRALDKDPAARYPSCVEFIADARDALGIEESRARRWPLAVAAVVLALLAAGLLAYALTQETPASAPTTSGRLVRIDPATNKSSETIQVGNEPNAVAVAPTGVWVTNRGDGTVWRIDPHTNLVSLKTSAHGEPTDLAVTSTRAFVVNGPQDANITVIDGATGREENVIGPSGGFSQGSAAIGADEPDVWLAGADRSVSRLDVVTAALAKPRFIAPPADEGSDAYFSSVAVAEGAVWVIGDPLDRTLWRIDSSSGELTATVPLPFAPKDVAVGERGVWVSSQVADTVSRVDPATGSVTDTVAVGAGASGVAVGFGSVWVANTFDGTISRVDPQTVEVTETIDVDGDPVDVATGEDAVWVVSTSASIAGSADSGEVRIGLVTVCEGFYGLTSEPSIAGAELPLLRRGATLAGPRPTDGVADATVAGKSVRLFFGCGDQTGETALAETRRLVEQVGVDVLIGPGYIGEGLAIKEYARSRPDVTFVATSPAQALTLHDPVPNLFRFAPDGAQLMAGVGAYAFHDLGWRKAVTVADDQSFDYTQVAGFVAEFCALGGTVEQVWVPPSQQTSPSYYAQLPQNVDGYVAAGFALNTLGLVNALPGLRGNLAEEVVGGILSSNLEVIGSQANRFVGVVYGENVPGLAGTPSPGQRAWRRYVREFSTTFPEYAALASSGFPIAHTNAMEAVLESLEAVEGDLSGDQEEFQARLALTELDAPNGLILLDANRNAVAPNYLRRVTKTANGLTMRTHATLPEVEQAFGGYFTSSVPLGRDTIECRTGDPPPWARR